MPFRGPRSLTHGKGNPTDQENRIAGRLGGKRVRGSGSSKYSKADVRDVVLVSDDDDVEFLVECKQTMHASISVKWDWLVKISSEASAVQKEPVLTVEIQGGRVDPGCDRDWALVPLRVLERLVGKKIGTG